MPAQRVIDRDWRQRLGVRGTPDRGSVTRGTRPRGVRKNSCNATLFRHALRVTDSRSGGGGLTATHDPLLCVSSFTTKDEQSSWFQSVS